MRYPSTPRLRIERLECRRVLSATVFEHDGVAYFLDQSDPGFERYAIAAEEWLSPIDLAGASGVPTAAHADDDGLYVAYGKSLFRYGSDGTAETFIVTTEYDIQRIHTDGDLLFVNHTGGNEGRLVSIDKTTNATIDSVSDFHLLYGSSIETESNSIFGLRFGGGTNYVARASYTNEGIFVADINSTFRNSYPSGSQVWVFDGDGRVADSAGTVFTTELQYSHSLGTTITDIDYTDSGRPLVLSGSTLTAFSSDLLPTGSAIVDAAAMDLFVNDRSAIVFDSALNTTVIPLSDLRPAEPGNPIDPSAYLTTLDNTEVTTEGVLLLYSRVNSSILRFDLVGQVWLETIPLVETPGQFVYSPHHNSVYVTYDNGLIRVIDLSATSPREEPFAILPRRPVIAAAGEFILALSPSPSYTFAYYTFASDGSLIDIKNARWNGGPLEWSDATRKAYFLRSGSPTDIIDVGVDENGVIGEERDSPLHSSTGFTYPIRVSPDGAMIALGSGRIHRSDTLANAALLGNAVADIAWIGSTPYTIRNFGGLAQVQLWSSFPYRQEGVAQLPGTAIAIHAVGEDRLAAVTLDSGRRVQVTVLNTTLGTVEKPTPVAIAGGDIVAILGQQAMLDGSSSHDPDASPLGLSYSWTLTEGPGEVVFGNAAAAVTTFSAEVAGVYKIRLTVSDGEFESSDAVAVHYRLNHPPVVDTTGSQTEGVANRASINLTAFQTTDPDYDPFSLAWDVIASPNGAAWVLQPTGYRRATFSADTAGVYEVRVTAFDGYLEGTDTIRVTISENQAPTPDVSRSVPLGVAGRRAARLDATATRDAEGDALSFFWEVLDGPELSAVTISGATSPLASLSSTVAGVYAVRLTVNDGLASGSVNIEVTLGENQAPVADASRSTTEAPSGSGSVRLDGTASIDPDDQYLSYSWRVVASSNDSTPSLTSSYYSVAYLSATQPGVYQIELTVSDGASSDTDLVIVTVAGNQKPIANASASHQLVVDGNNVALDGSLSTDPDGNPLRYIWTVVASTATPSPLINDPHAVRATLFQPSVGAYMVRLQVSDGLASGEHFVLITVRERYNHAWTGDFNGDGWVDAADYTVYRDLQGVAVQPFTYADATGDGNIDDFDREVWFDAYGSLAAGDVKSASTAEETPLDSAFAVASVKDARTIATFSSKGETTTTSLHAIAAQADQMPASPLNVYNQHATRRPIWKAVPRWREEQVPTAYNDSLARMQEEAMLMYVNERSTMLQRSSGTSIRKVEREAEPGDIITSSLQRFDSIASIADAL